MNEDNQHLPANNSHPVLLGLGVAATVFTSILAARIIWEETLLTIDEGPQMVGFSLAHNMGAILFLAPILLTVWLATAIVVLAISLIRKRSIAKPFWITLASAVLVLGFLSLPEQFWQWAFVGSFARSAHSADLMTSAAAEGYEQTVRGYLNHGVPIEARNYEGSTSAFTAAAGGSTPVLKLLASRGADLNATNSYGDSPLAAAVGNKHDDAAAFLRAQGARLIEGTPEQREAATKAIVDKDIERQNSLR